jgi:hypothetical protein
VRVPGRRRASRPRQQRSGADAHDVRDGCRARLADRVFRGAVAQVVAVRHPRSRRGDVRGRHRVLPDSG